MGTFWIKRVLKVLQVLEVPGVLVLEVPGVLVLEVPGVLVLEVPWTCPGSVDRLALVNHR